jgi:hypothetical protein
VGIDFCKTTLNIKPTLKRFVCDTLAGRKRPAEPFGEDLIREAGAHISHTMYELNGFRTSTSPHNCQLISFIRNDKE